VVAARIAAETRIVSPGRGTPALSNATIPRMIHGPWIGIKLIKASDKEVTPSFDWFQIREDAITTLAANCLDGGFEMLTIFHGASPDSKMFAID
jgi:hypothetical protein